MDECKPLPHAPRRRLRSTGNTSRVATHGGGRGGCRAARASAPECPCPGPAAALGLFRRGRGGMAGIAMESQCV